MSSRRNDGLGLLLVLGLVGLVWIYNWISANPGSALLIFCVVAGLVLVGVHLYKEGQSKVREVAKSTIREHAIALRRRREQTLFVGHYGELDASAWVREKSRFFENVLVYSLPGSDQISEIDSYLADSKLRAFCFDLIEEVAREQDAFVDDDPSSIVDPLDFERWCAAKLNEQGWDARTTKGSGDQGADVIAERGGVRVVLQCKLYSSKVGNKAVQEAHAAKVFEDADFACVVTSAGYTPSARSLAKRTGVLLLHSEDLLDFDAALEIVESSAEPATALGGADLTTAYASENEKARTILQTRPAHWDFLLVEQLLLRRLDGLKTSSQSPLQQRPVDAPRFLQIVMDSLEILADASERSSSVVRNDILAAIGAADNPADPIALLRAIDSVESWCHAAMKCEKQILGRSPPELLEPLRDNFKGISVAAVATLEKLSTEWTRALQDIERGSKEFNVRVSFELPQLEKIGAEVARLQLMS